MFRQITAILLLLAMGAQVFNRNFLVLDYYTNTASFVRNCENKARPELSCEGKCQLMKKIMEEEQKDQENPERRVDRKVEVISSKSFFATVSTQYYTVTRSFSHYYFAMLPEGAHPSVFHPPVIA